MTENSKAAPNKRNECFFIGKLQSVTPYQTQAGEQRAQIVIVCPADDEYSYPERISVRTSGARAKTLTNQINSLVSIRARAVTVFRQNNGREYDSTSLYEIES